MKLFMSFCTLAAAYAGTMMAIAPSEAEAADRRIGAGYCHDSASNTSTYNGEWFYNPNIGYIGGFCTIPSDSYLNHASVNTLNIHGYNNPGGATTVRACATDWASGDASCGNYVSTTNYHFNTTVTDLSVWHAHPSWFPYVFVSLSPNSGIYGLWIST